MPTTHRPQGLTGRLRPWGRALLVAVIAATAAAAVWTVGGATTTPGARTGRDSWVLPRLNRPGVVRLADFRGRPVVVNFYASWCSVCDGELPNFAVVSVQFRGRVQFVGVDALDAGDPLLMPRRHHLLWWPLARDQGGRDRSGLHDHLGAGAGIPVTAFYDAAGHLVDVERGALTAGQLRADIDELLTGRLRPWTGRTPLSPVPAGNS